MCVCEGERGIAVCVCVCEGGKVCAFVRLCVLTCGSVTFVYVLCLVMFHARMPAVVFDVCACMAAVLCILLSVCCVCYFGCVHVV